MEQLQIFNKEEFGEIRTAVVNNEPMFCLADVCRALEISNTGNVKNRLNEKGIHNVDTPTNGGIQKMVYISESNLYKVIFQSRKESAEKFTEWVTSEVLPSIRRTGGYEMSKPMSAMQLMELQFQAIKEVKADVDSLNKDLQDFKQDMPLLAVECEKITRAKNQKVVNIMGGKKSNAYKDNSLRGKVYRDVDSQLRREFGINTYKAIKRSQCDKAIEIINNYVPPMVLSEQIEEANAQISF